MPELSFEPGRLRLARELRKLSQAQLARLSEVSAAAISQFESGTIRPSERVLLAMSTSLDTPAEFFQRPLMETHAGFFRSLRRTSVADRQRARAIAHIVHDLATDEGASFFPRLDVPRWPLSGLEGDLDAASKAARLTREAWGVPPGPILDVVGLLEEHGIAVVRLPFDTSDVDAFSLPFEDRPVIVLGSDKADRARSRFDAAHELGHLVLHGDHVWGTREVEQEAHAFAAEFLMPERDIHQELPRRADWPTLFALKQRWQVSLAALLLRAKNLATMSDANYLNAVKASSARGWRRTEPVPLGQPETPTKTGALLRAASDMGTGSWAPTSVVSQLVAVTGAG